MSKGDHITMTGEVIQVLPNARFNVKLENGHIHTELRNKPSDNNSIYRTILIILHTRRGHWPMA